MTHEIQIIIDNAGGINLRIDDWYSYYGRRGATACVSDIIEVHGMCLDAAWGDWIDGNDNVLEGYWETLEGHCDSVVIHTSADLAEGVGGRAGEALRQALKERSVTF